MKIMLDDGAICPTRSHPTDAGLDLYSREDKVIFPRQVMMYDSDGFATAVPVGEIFDTGVHIELPHGTYARVSPRSGLNAKHEICTFGCVIDEGYTGSIKIKLYNFGNKPYTVHKGDRICQLVIMPYLTPGMEVVDKLSNTPRGDSGFGSTGK